MRPHRKSTTAAFLALILAASLPAASSANPLLSGYGGPGQGNQAILGSALLNTPRGRSGGSGGSSLAVPPAPSGGEASRESSSRIAPQAARRAGGARHAQPSVSSSKASASGSQPYTSSTPARTAVVRDVSQPLGLSGTDLLYLFLAAGVLVATAAITRRMGR